MNKSFILNFLSGILIVLLVSCGSHIDVNSLGEKNLQASDSTDDSGPSTPPPPACPNPAVENLTVTPAFSGAPLWNDYIENNEANFYDAVDGSGLPNTGFPCNQDGVVDGGTRDTATSFRYNTCIHAGEIRRVVTTENSCTRLTASDSLGTFDWTCSDSGGVAVFYSQLKPTHGLRDLLTASAFRANSIEVQKDGCPAYTSASSVWFTNTVRSLDSITPPISLGATGVTGVTAVTNTDTTSGGTNVVDIVKFEGENIIYTLNKDIAFEGIWLGNKVSFVILGNNEFTFTPSANNNCGNFNSVGNVYQCGVALSQNYNWLEGNINLNEPAADGAVNVYGTYHMLRNLRVREPNGPSSFRNSAIYMFRSHYGKNYNIEVFDDAPDGDSPGMYVYQSQPNFFYNLNLHDLDYGLGMESNFIHDFTKVTISNTLGRSFNFNLGGPETSVFSEIRLYNIQDDGFFRNSSNGNNIYHDFVIANASGMGVRTNNQVTNDIYSRFLVVGTNNFGYEHFRSDNTAVSLMTVANTSLGLIVSDTATNNTFSNILTTANGGNGIYLAVDSDNNMFQNIASLHNGANALGIENTVDNQTFIDNFLFGNNLGPAECFVDTVTTATFDTGLTNCTHGSVDLTTRETDLTTTFVGKALSDSSNADFGAGTVVSGNIAYDDITDFYNWDNPFRAFTQAVVADQVSSTNAGQCAGVTNCSAWDWRLRATDAEVLNINGIFQDNAACPNSVHGDEVLTVTNGQGVNTYLKNAWEIIDDDIGDNDTLCESNEICIYAPNIGYYQGEGNLGTCNFDDGTPGPGGTTSVIDVIMRGYLTNGAVPESI